MAKPSMLRFEEAAWDAGHAKVAGIDEAGRGPLAGDVVAAAVLFRASALAEDWSGLTDSKQLSEARREEFYQRLTEHPDVIIGTGFSNPKEIDRVNILNATHLAMGRAASVHEDCFFLVDGRPVPNLPGDSQSIIKGDSKSLFIAAASIIAKVSRDRDMRQAAEKWPEYGFERHKGYGTKIHLEALKQYGPCPIHRRSFRPVTEQHLF